MVCVMREARLCVRKVVFADTPDLQLHSMRAQTQETVIRFFAVLDCAVLRLELQAAYHIVSVS